MQRTCLLEKEIDGINLFISKVVDIPSVEGVYLLPYLSRINDYKFSVIAVFDSNLATSNGDFINIEDNKKLLNNIFRDGRIRFTSQDIMEKPSPLTHNWYFFTEQALASGTILLDKSGNISAKKRHLEQRMGTFPNIVAVSNIDSLTPNDIALEYTKRK